MKKEPHQAISDLYFKRALPICDIVLQSPLSPEETMRVIDQLADQGYVRKYHGDSVVAMTHRGLNAGRNKLIASLE